MIDRQLLRNVYGSFPVGVTVVATQDSTGVRRGMTASSFNSISMDPPLVSISVTEQTPSHDALTKGEEFAVSILSADQADLARKFATPAEDKFSGVEFEPTGHVSPVLAGSSAWLMCKPVEVLTVGDHSLLIGEVVECRFTELPPLAYQRGGFHSLTGHEHGDADKELRGLVSVGFIAEYESKIAMIRDSGQWTIPVGHLSGGATIDEALRTTARSLLGAELETDFLYSITDLHDHLNCSIYRGRLVQAPAESGQVRWFAEHEIPWDELGNPALVNVIRRYLKERVADQFGVFVSVGGGRLATIQAESAWPAERD